MLPGTDEYLDLPYDFDSMAKAGSMLGSGAIIVIDDSTPIVDVALQDREVLPPRVLRQVHAVPRGHELDREDARAHRDTGEATPMDLDIMSSVQEQIIGNCLCVLGDAMAMPIGSMIKHFRGEFEAHIEAARERNGLGAAIPHANRGRTPARARCASPAGVGPDRGGRLDAAARGQLRSRSRSTAARSPRPRTSMLVDGAKYGDVEIPVFCYEPKLGQPVGACRMCLVEIEGIPKLQTACSTPVKDGMVVHTQTERVHDAQRAVVEFLLINHPLDCPVCDKGGECPLQDITYGWGPGTSRFIEPKRHFVKPLELSPLIAIDRERCILCYRCVRFSQEISEDYQLILLERGAHSLRRHVRRAPVRRRRSAATSSSCARSARSPRARTASARARGTSRARARSARCARRSATSSSPCATTASCACSRATTTSVDDGWLCDKGRFAYQSIHVDERHRRAARARGHRADARVVGEGAGRRVERAEEGGRQGRRAGRRRDHQRGGVPARAAVPRRPRLRPPRVARRRRAAGLDVARALADPALQATVPDLEFAHAVLRARLRPDRRRADPRPAHPQGRAPQRRAGSRSRARGRPRWTRTPTRRSATRPAPARRCSSRSTRRSPATTATSAARPAAAGTNAEAVRALADLLHGRRRGHRDRLRRAPALGPASRARALLNVATRLGLRGRAGAGLLEMPVVDQRARPARGRLRARPRRRASPTLAEPGRDAPAIAAGARRAATCASLWLLHADPLRTHPRPRRCGSARWHARRP